MRQGQGFCMPDNPRAWLFQAARNAVVDRFRPRTPPSVRYFFQFQSGVQQCNLPARGARHQPFAPALRKDRMVLEALEAGGQQLAADEWRTAGRAVQELVLVQDSRRTARWLAR